MNIKTESLLLLLLWSVGFPVHPVAAQDHSSDLKAEEAESYFDKWANEDVAYILTDNERDVFEDLTTLDEKEQFIEQFWFRRDPDPRTIENEFKEEHYRRIAYANEHFSSGKTGWRTDRGRIYIIHGPRRRLKPILQEGSTKGPFPRVAVARTLILSRSGGIGISKVLGTT